MAHVSGFSAKSRDSKKALSLALKAALLGCWTNFGGAGFVNQVERTTKSRAQNEPLFTPLATPGCLTSATPAAATGVTLIKEARTLARCVCRISPRWRED